MAVGKFSNYYKPMLATLVDQPFDHKDLVFDHFHLAVSKKNKSECSRYMVEAFFGLSGKILQEKQREGCSGTRFI